MSAPVVIIGTGLAGYNLAKEWRKLDTQTPLLLITADDDRSYSKPMLSTGFGKNKDADGLAMAEAAPVAAACPKDVASIAQYQDLQRLVQARAHEYSTITGRPFHSIYFDLWWNDRYRRSGGNLFEVNLG